MACQKAKGSNNRRPRQSAFRALYEEDRMRAGEIARTALEYLESQS